MNAEVGLPFRAMPEEKRPKSLMHRVLVVDDDHDLAVLLSEVLTFENWRGGYRRQRHGGDGLPARGKL